MYRTRREQAYEFSIKCECIVTFLSRSHIYMYIYWIITHVTLLKHLNSYCICLIFISLTSAFSSTLHLLFMALVMLRLFIAHSSFHADFSISLCNFFFFHSFDCVSIFRIVFHLMCVPICSVSLGHCPIFLLNWTPNSIYNPNQNDIWLPFFSSWKITYKI